MKVGTITLTFPKDKTEEITILGSPFIRIDTGLTIEDFMLVLMQIVDKKGIAVVEKSEEVNENENEIDIPSYDSSCLDCKHWDIPKRKCEAWDERGSSGPCDLFKSREADE